MRRAQGDNPLAGTSFLANGWRDPGLVTAWRSVKAGILFCLFASFFLGATGSRVWAAAAAVIVPVKSVAQITVDDDGRPLGYPTAVFFDPVEEEIYVVNSSTSRVVVYGPDFFPRVSIGVGSKVGAPRGGVVLSNGEVYLCQIRSYKSAATRLTILNGAFFVDREILLEQIPEAANFLPRALAVSRDGLIYLAGDNFRGLLVLDNDGNFLRKLQPTDQISAHAQEEVERQVQEQEKLLLQESPGAIAGTEVVPAAPDNAFADIPEEFRPRSGRQNRETSSEPGIGPVKVNNVVIDSSGKLYLLSEEAGKIYVYGPDESLLFSFGEKGGSPRQLSQPKSLAIDEKRELIYVVDYMRHTILVYNLSGEFLFEVGGRGFAPGWFNFPSAIAINNQQQIIVADLFNKRVQVLEVGYDKSLFNKEDKELIEFMEEMAKSKDGAESDGDQSENEEIAAPEGTPPQTQDAPVPDGAPPENEGIAAPDRTLPENGKGTEADGMPPKEAGKFIEQKSTPGVPLEKPVEQIEEVIIQDLQIPTESAGAKDQASQSETPEVKPDSGSAQ